LEDDVAALRPERHLDRIGQDVDTTHHPLARVGGKLYFFRCHFCFSPLNSVGSKKGWRELQPRMPMMSDSFMIRSSSPSSLTSVPDHLPNSTLSPALTPMGWSLPFSPLAPGPAATTWPVCGFSAAVSGMMMPPLVLSSSSSRLTTTRSWSGRNFMTLLLNCLGSR